MIVDSSAVLAVVLGEEDAETFLSVLVSADKLAISAATLVEAGMVAYARQGEEAFSDLHSLLADLECDVLAFDEEQAEVALKAWNRFGKGRHPAGLNLGDCYSYAVAQQLGRPLLFKGNDFPQTDVRAAR
ncbi:type II toxin-antitoxin system VapC family toxin [Ammonicoccus fulvus]|uniref:Ribonuclease VapC n=1 Tax=Ammonicoccus fulvus TaxID=3138240 RepID=A0ABZ3FNW9_9ACTN